MADDAERSRPAGLSERVRRPDAATVIRVTSLVLGLIALVFSALRFNEFFDARADERVAAESAVIAATDASAAAVNVLLASIESAVDEVAAGLSDGTVDDRLAERLAAASADPGRAVDQRPCRELDPTSAELEPRLCATARDIPELNGIGVVYATRYDPATTYRPYVNRIGGPLVLGELVQRDFEATDWYVNAVEHHGAWTHPRFGLTSQKLLAYYAAPFVSDDGAVRGVVLATYALDRLAADLRWLSVGSTGYSVVLSDEGKVVSHPSEQLVIDELEGSERLGADLRPSASTTVAAFREAALADGSPTGFLDGLTDDVTDAPAWLAWSPIEAVGWTYGAVVVEREVYRRTAEQNRLLIDAGLALLAGVLLACVVLFGAHRGSDRALWAISVTAGVLAVIGIGWVWYLTLTGPGEDRTAAADVDWPDAAAIDDAFAPPVDDGEPVAAGPLFAGVFVQSVEFTGANDVTVSGIVWQERRDDAGLAEPPGFVFPEADEMTITEEYRSTDGNLTRIGWSFTSSLRQTFDYSRYPLDRETVWLRLWPADYSLPWLMLPELTSYETLAPSAKPGIERDFVVEGWELEASSFSYRDNAYNTDFGLRNIADDPTPELYFNIHLKRSFLDAAMSQLVPLSVVAVLLFGVLLISTRRRAADDALDFSALGVLGYCAALFFVVILSHEQLRSKLNSSEIIYLEYFYFTTYVAILGVSANAILVGAGRGGRLIDYRNNLLPSLVYWPALNGVMLAITVISFY